MIAGVAGGVAEHLDADPSLIRIVWAVLIFLTGGLALLVYIVMAIVVPGTTRGHGPSHRLAERQPRDAGFGSEPVPAGSWRAPDGSTVPMATSTARPPRRRRDPADRARAGLIGGVVLDRPRVASSSSASSSRPSTSTCGGRASSSVSGSSSSSSPSMPGRRSS